MATKKDPPQKAALREMMGNYLKGLCQGSFAYNKVKDGTDVREHYPTQGVSKV